MRVTYVTRFSPAHCGIAEYARYLTSELIKFRQVDVICVYGNAEAKATRHGKLRVIPVFNEKIEGYYRELEKVLRSKEPLIHVQFEYGVFHADECPLKLVEVLREKTDKLVITMHSVSHFKRGGKWVEIQSFFGEQADAIIVHNMMQAFELIVQGVSPKKVHVIPHGTKVFRVLPREEAFRALKLEGIEGKRVILFMGFIRSDKGLIELMEAFELVKKEVRDVKLVIAGKEQFLTSQDVDYARVVLRRAKETEGVTLINEYLNDEKIELLLSVADVVVFPYRLFKPGEEYYSVSGALHLAMGAGKVIVASKVPKMAEYYELVPELTYTPGDTDELAEKTVKALTDGELRELAMRRVLKYREETRWEKVAKEHLKLYKKLLG